MKSLSLILLSIYKAFVPAAVLFYLALVFFTPLEFEVKWFVLALIIDVFNEIRE